MTTLRKLAPAEELEYLKEIHGEDHSKLFSVLIGKFDVLQSRAQMLLGLITICLTITGFSGPNIAASSTMSKFSISIGLTLVLISALILLIGPLQVRWGTQRRAETIDASLEELIRIRNSRSQKYIIASVVLILGLTGYVGSLVAYLFQL